MADTVPGLLHLPAWAGTFVVMLVIAGFPIVLVLAWFLEFRDGRAVFDTGSRRGARRRQFSRTYLSVIGALAIAAVAVYIYDTRVGLPQPEQPTPAPVSAEANLPPVLDNSIAVLPFLNLDGSEETQIFTNGLVDDVITRLSRVPGLLVSSRGDAYSLDPNTASGRVRERLRVARYLEGSVQMTPSRMRIIVQLIDSETGFHELSRSFDRPREDFFDIRDEITALTVANVRVALPPETQTAAEPLGEDPSLDVYVLYRRGIEVSRLPWSIETLETALKWFEAALAIDVEYAAAYAGKCRVYVDSYPVTDDSDFIHKAEDACARALELNPNLDIVHTALGELYTATGRYESAETAFRAALDIDPESAESLSGLGEIFMLQQKTDLAEQSYRQAIGLHPGDWTPYNELGHFLYRSGRFAEAAEQYEYVVALDNRNTIGFTNLGTAYLMAGDFESAEPAFMKVIEIEPRQSAYTNLGLLNYYLGRFEEAIDAHLKAIDMAPNDHLARINLGDALWIAGYEQRAREVFEDAERLAISALQVNPNNPGTLMDLAWISAMLDKFKEAYRQIASARAMAPEDPYVHYINGLILMRDTNTEAALYAFEIALEKGYSATLLAADPQLVGLRHIARFKRSIKRSKTR